MIFIEFRFLFFFLTVFGIYWILRKHNHRKFWLLACSYLFYGAWDWRFLSLMLVSTEEITVENLDHLGIVAGLIDEIGIMELINQKLGVDNREKITTGQVIKALILNGLGMVSRPLYLFSQFFEDKAIEKLNRTGINSEYLNDDKIGLLMDDIYKLGLTNLFIEIGLLVIKKFKIDTSYAHLDSTSFHLHGEYNNIEIAENDQERPILITKGYSRDHRPDLKQYVLDLIVKGFEKRDHINDHTKDIVILNKYETFFCLKYFYSQKHLSQFSQRNDYIM